MSEEIKKADDLENLELQAIEDEIEEIDAEVFEDIPAEKKGRLMRAMLIMRSSSHSGPLPCPEDLEKYNHIIPNGADRITIMAERQNFHRIEIEKVVVNSNNRQSSTGQWMGFLLALFCISSSVYLGAQGHDVLAGVLGGSTLISLITVFVLGKRAQKDE